MLLLIMFQAIQASIIHDLRHLAILNQINIPTGMFGLIVHGFPAWISIRAALYKDIANVMECL
jgi:hypothetical protein